MRGELYRLLCEHVWDAERLGFPAPRRPAPEPTAEAPVRVPVPRRRPLRTDLARMMRAAVLAPGSELEGVHRGVRHTVAVDADGVLTLPSGDRYNTADEAGKVVSGTRSCPGMAFWHITTPDGRRLSLRELRNEAQQDGRLTGARAT